MLLTRETRCVMWRNRWRLGVAVGFVMAAVVATLVVHASREPRGAPAERTRSERARPRLPQHLSVAAGLVLTTVEPECILGPDALCARLRPAVDVCVAGNAGTCRAIAAELEAAPPYPSAAIVFYNQSCRLGDEAACARMREVNRHLREPVDCDVDRLACLRRAHRNRDVATLARLCVRGVADACASMRGVR